MKSGFTAQGFSSTIIYRFYGFILLLRFDVRFFFSHSNTIMERLRRLFYTLFIFALVFCCHHICNVDSLIILTIFYHLCCCRLKSLLSLLLLSSLYNYFPYDDKWLMTNMIYVVVSVRIFNTEDDESINQQVLLLV